MAGIARRGEKRQFHRLPGHHILEQRAKGTLRMKIPTEILPQIKELFETAIRARRIDVAFIQALTEKLWRHNLHLNELHAMVRGLAIYIAKREGNFEKSAAKFLQDVDQSLYFALTSDPPAIQCLGIHRTAYQGTFSEFAEHLVAPAPGNGSPKGEHDQPIPPWPWRGEKQVSLSRVVKYLRNSPYEIPARTTQHWFKGFDGKVSGQRGSVSFPITKAQFITVMNKRYPTYSRHHKRA